MRRSWEVSLVSDGELSDGAGKGNRNPAIHASEKSDTPIVSKKLPNKARPAEEVEKRGVAKGSVVEFPICRTQCRKQVSKEFNDAREVVRRERTMKCHVINPRQEPCAVIPLAGICAGGVG